MRFIVKYIDTWMSNVWDWYIYIDFRNEDENNMIFKHYEKSLDYLCVETTICKRSCD